MRFLRFLLFFRRRSRAAATPIREDEAYARSYGDRSGEIISVARLPAPEPAAEPEPPLVEAVPAPEPQRIPRRTGDMTGELLRRAFEAKLDARGRTSHAS